MKIYIAARTAKKEEIERLYARLETAGHEITNKWTAQSPIKPYQENQATAQRYIAEDFRGIEEAELFILLAESEPDARGCYVELGYALRLSEESRSLKIFVVDESDTPSLFFFHPNVTRVSSIQDIPELASA